MGDDENKNNFDLSLVFLSKLLTYLGYSGSLLYLGFMFLSEHENLSLGILKRNHELLEWHTELGRINILN